MGQETSGTLYNATYISDIKKPPKMKKKYADSLVNFRRHALNIMSLSRSLWQLNEARSSTKFRFPCARAILILGHRKRTQQRITWRVGNCTLINNKCERWRVIQLNRIQECISCSSRPTEKKNTIINKIYTRYKYNFRTISPLPLLNFLFLFFF